VSRPTPDRPDEEEELIARLVSECGDPTVEPRPEHVAALRTLLLEHLAPPGAARPWRVRRLACTALTAACLVAALLWFPPRVERTAPGRDSDRSGPHVAHRSPDDTHGRAPRVAALDEAEIPTFHWPLQETVSLTVSSPVPRDLLD
jgi:hypothetical protein